MNSTVKSLSLNGAWELIERPLAEGVDAYAAVRGEAGTFVATVPGDVNDDICRSGKLPEPLVALNFREYSSWVPERSWWYRKSVKVPASRKEPFAELSLDGLDVHADVWFNDTYLGHHGSAYFPFKADVSKLIRRGGENCVMVRLTTGRERVKDLQSPLFNCVPTEATRGYNDRGWPQRIFLRKPAYTWGWDWSPYLPTCGITGNCSLNFTGTNSVENIRLDTSLDAKGAATVSMVVELCRRTVIGTAWGTVRVRLTDESRRSFTVEKKNVLVRGGTTFVDLSLDVAAPRLWWPNGSGAQHRYTAEVWLECEGETLSLAPFRWGMRTVEMDVAPGLFRFRINGLPLFIQGSNWCPCDHLYGRVTPQRLRHLVSEMVAANFNCTRVWGGNRFEPDAFFEACDEKGILIWHDFMSACAPLPYDDKEFADLFRQEAFYQMRRLRNHPSMMLWCGNNEVGACYDWEWFKNNYGGGRDPAWTLYFEDLPRWVAAEGGSIPYWPTSPYGGKDSVSDLTVGDDHHWVVMKPESEFWSNPEYWDGKAISIFNSEYGYGGPTSLASAKDYLGTDKPDLFSPVGHEHTNTFYDIPRVNFSIEAHYRSAKDLPIEEYIRLGGLCQGLNLGYSLESLRANDQTWGGIFWMYNDAWGENGWTIIDYYLRRKISFYNVKRCLAPQRLVLRRGGQGFGGKASQVLLILLNNSEKPLRGSVRFGYQRYDGTGARLKTVRYTLPPRSKKVIATCAVPTAAQLKVGSVVALGAPGLDSAWWRHNRYKNLNLPSANVEIVSQKKDGKDCLVTVRSTTLAHAVNINVPDDYHLSDQWFDLLPGESKTVRIIGGARLGKLTATCVNAS